MTRKEQKEMRQKQIMFKALELFVTKGYTETKISDIAEALGISVGLLFHYYESKEKLYEALIRMGIETAKIPLTIPFNDPLEFFTRSAEGIFTAAENSPWVSQMFVLMSQARRQGVTEELRQLALSAEQIHHSSELVKQGQAQGVIKDGDPIALSFAFWSSIQGIMEQHLIAPEYPLPKAEWISDILKK